MARKPPYRAVAKIDPAALASFQAGIRKRYSNDQILRELRASAERLGRSPTMREFAADGETTVHPQTVIEHFGSWNAAKREAGLVPRRFATREELLQLLKGLGDELRRPPTARDFDERKGSLPSKPLSRHTLGSLTAPLREARFPVAAGDERPLRQLVLAELRARVALDDFERLARRGEEELVAAEPQPERPADAAGQVEHVRSALVHPGGRHRAAQLLESAGVGAG